MSKNNSQEVLKSIIVSKELAARGQLETVIMLWFHYADPVSIHTLAAAAQGILQDVAGKNHKLSHMRIWVKNFPADVQGSCVIHRTFLNTPTGTGAESGLINPTLEPY